MNNRLAKEIMTTPVRTIRDNEIISNFVEKILKHKINGMPVLDDNGNIIGMATRNELLDFELKRELGILYEKKLQQIYKRYMNESQTSSFEEISGQFNRTITVKDIMQIDFVTADKDTPIKEICRSMKNRQTGYVIITGGKKISGIITSSDIIRFLAEED